MEKKELFAGLMLSPEGAQVTWYDDSLNEPATLTLKDTKEDALKELPAGAWKGAVMGSGYSLEKLGDFLKDILMQIPDIEDLNQLSICVTVPSLNRKMSENISQSLSTIGIERRKICFQDFSTSFYYYVINKRREYWNTDVALLEYKDEKIIGYILHIDRTVKPALVTLNEGASEDLGSTVRGNMNDEDWDRERDRLFYELLGRLFERRNVSTSYLYGNYFDKSWAVRSFQYLTFRRHAFQGQNLFSKGACYGAMARFGKIRMPDMIFKGVDMVKKKLGIRMRVKGREQYYPLAEAGVNWYEAHSVCEFIPDGERSICIIEEGADEHETISHIIRLDHFPDRKNRASRLRLTVYFTDARECICEVEDLGFGGFYKSSGRVWRRKIRLQADAEEEEKNNGPGAEAL